MEALPQINLPFWETIRRSFLYVFVNFEVFLKISAIWFLVLVFEVVFDFPSLCSMDMLTCRKDGYQNISIILISMASIAVTVAYCRGVILKSQYKFGTFHFGIRELKYLGYSLLLILIMMIPIFLSMLLTTKFLSLIGAPERFLVLVPLVALAVAIIGARFFIIFPAVAVDNKEIDMYQAFKLTKGNANKIFWGQILVMLPVILCYILLAAIYSAIIPTNDIIKFIFVAIIIGLSYFDACLKASFQSHVYQYIMYFAHQAQEKDNA